MRTSLLLLPALAALSGCAVEKAELARPYVAARIDSPKSASAFAECAAKAMGLTARNDEGVITIIRKDRLGVEAARWDFLTTNNGSQAELRTGARDGDGMEELRACA